MPRLGQVQAGSRRGLCRRRGRRSAGHAGVFYQRPGPVRDPSVRHLPEDHRRRTEKITAGRLRRTRPPAGRALTARRYADRKGPRRVGRIPRERTRRGFREADAAHYNPAVMKWITSTVALVFLSVAYLAAQDLFVRLPADPPAKNPLEGNVDAITAGMGAYRQR